ncbi:hypothetical protein GCM10010172_74400 [Paractinoplanes ferrugineus]|uniref:HYR domain-containing protein n=1 Tax=Paractinoplanes ferrugineus TaxID=113564 RepID=A0A919ME90_9ACTN|nr:hypothetical protein Afe05nite_32440 [Actinoplanes ferrugineus]
MVLAAASFGLSAAPVPALAATRTVSAAAPGDLETHPLTISAIDVSPASPAVGAILITPTIDAFADIKVVKMTVTGPNGRAANFSSSVAPYAMTWNSAGQTGSAKIVVTATDTLGNTTVASTTVLVDNTPPSATVTLPSLVAATTPVTLDNPSADTAKMDVYLKNDLIGSTTSAPWTVPWDTTGYTGTVTLKIVVTDTAGNTAASTKTLGIDNTGPKLTWAGPIGSAKTAMRGTIQVKAGAADPAGVVSVEVVGPDGTVLGEDAVSPYVIPVDTSDFNGSTVFTLRSTDKLGNTSTLDQTLVFDNTAPVIADVAISPAPPARGVVTIAPDISDNTGIRGVSITLALPSGRKVNLAANVAPYAVSWVSNGTTGDVTATVTATDFAGNASTSTETFRVDNLAPSALWTLPNYVNGVVPIALSDPADDTALMELQIKGKTVTQITSAPWSIDWDTTGLSGPVPIAIRVTDTAGNVSQVLKTIVADYTGPIVAVVSTNKLIGPAQIRLSVTDLAGTASVELLDATGASLATATNGPYTLNVDTTSMKKGPVTWTLKATDKLGNVRSVQKSFFIS